jgi:hypothetical protein
MPAMAYHTHDSNTASELAMVHSRRGAGFHRLVIPADKMPLRNYLGLAVQA